MTRGAEINRVVFPEKHTVKFVLDKKQVRNIL